MTVFYWYLAKIEKTRPCLNGQPVYLAKLVSGAVKIIIYYNYFAGKIIEFLLYKGIPRLIKERAIKIDKFP